MKVTNLPCSNISAGCYIIAGSDTSLHFALTEDAAKNIIDSIISDMVYQKLGGDDEFLYDEEGNILPDEQIIDSIDEILELGQDAGICYIDENNNWAYAGDAVDYKLQFSVYQIV